MCPYLDGMPQFRFEVGSGNYLIVFPHEDQAGPSEVSIDEARSPVSETPIDIGIVHAGYHDIFSVNSEPLVQKAGR